MRPLAPDSGVFHVRVQGVDVATDTFTSDVSGGSTSVVTEARSDAGKTLRISIRTDRGMLAGVDTATPDGDGFRLTVSAASVALAQTARGAQTGPPRPLKAPDRLFPFSSVAPDQLRLLIAAYDPRAGGPQSFNVVYTNTLRESSPIFGLLTVAAAGSRTETVHGRPTVIVRYRAIIPAPAGSCQADILTDSSGRVLLYRLPAQGLVASRDDSQELAAAEPPGESATTYRVTVEQNVRIPMRDGVTLAADVYRPDSAGRFPVIVQRTCQGRQYIFEAADYARRGFVYVAQDVRGRWGSGGEWRPFVNEGADGADSVEWCTRQRWSSRRIGMAGAGYQAYTQWAAAAAEGSQRLACILPIDAPSDYTVRMRSVPELPVLHVCGWFGAPAGTLRNFADMVESGHNNQRLICGPWAGATGIDARIPGEEIGASDIIDLDAIAQRWFDRWLRAPQGARDSKPEVRIFMLGANLWREFTAWPPRESRPMRWYLHSGGTAGPSLSTDPPKDAEPPDTYDYDPAAALPASRLESVGPLAPADRAAHTAQIVTYDSAPLESDLTLAGPVIVHLAAESSARDTDWYAALLDVPPHGEALPLTHGIVATRLRRSAASPTIMRPGEVADTTIDLSSIGAVLRKRHRIRVVIASACPPRFAGYLSAGGNRLTVAPAAITHQRIYHSPGRVSYIVLPTVARSRR